MLSFRALLVTGSLLMGCAAPALAQDQKAEQTAMRALREAPVFDGHNDVPIQLRSRYDNRIGEFDFTDTSNTATEDRGMMHTDLPRLRQGRVGAQWWSVYVSGDQPEADAVRQTIEQIDVTKRLVARYPDDLVLALSAQDVERAVKAGRIASLIGMEGGHSIGSSLAILRQMYDLGARYMTLTHNQNTPWADSATAPPEHDGLTDFGKAVVREMNRIGMLVDLSHVSEKTMHDALDTAVAPVIFSHSGARGVAGHPRNVPDSVLRRLPKNGGVVHVVALPWFVTEELRQHAANRAAEEARLDSLYRGQVDEVARLLEVWDAANPPPPSTISDVADHIDHVRTVAGIDHIAIGGDYDGMPTGPSGMEDVSGYPALFTELARRGYSQKDLEKISMRNALRALREAERVSARLANTPPDDRLIDAQ